MTWGFYLSKGPLATVCRMIKGIGGTVRRPEAALGRRCRLVGKRKQQTEQEVVAKGVSGG